MLNNKKYILQKTAGYALCTIMTLTIFQQAHSLTKTSIPFTKEDIKNNKEYAQAIVEIQSTKPDYKNKDLIVELFNQGIDIEHPENVKQITLTNQLLNNDFSDFKYFPNLVELTIENNDIDLTDLQYNYNLINLKTTNCNLTNTKHLPNSIYNLVIQDSIIEDNSFEIPYNTKYLTVTNSPFNNIFLKNPKKLNRLTIIGNTFLDLKSLEECVNLKEITLHRIVNLSNSNILTKFKKANFNFDNYAPIWMSKSTYEKIDYENAETITKINELDSIISSIIKENMTDEEKTKAITTYILSLLNYDEEITSPELKDYNEYPLILTKQNGICINYASLFTALANRAGLNTYQIYSNDHTWNMIKNDSEKYFIDLSMLDTEVIIETLTEYGVEYSKSTISSVEHLNNNDTNLYHYHITLEELVNDNTLSKYTLLPEEEKTTQHNIGYISNKGISIEYNNNLYFIEYKNINKLLAMLAIVTVASIYLFKKKDKTYSIK